MTDAERRARHEQECKRIAALQAEDYRAWLLRQFKRWGMREPNEALIQEYILLSYDDENSGHQ